MVATPDIILISIDCWRPDAPQAMPRFKRIVDNYSESSIIANGAATNGVFPAIFASQYYPSVYAEDGCVKPDVETLPNRLSDFGYETGAFVASNPFLGKWADQFDEFWNDGMTITDPSANRDQISTTEKLRDFVLLRERVPATDIANRAKVWFESTSKPRFLWMHLMDLHEPLSPGLLRSLQVGLIQSYRSLIQYTMKKQDAPDNVHKHLRDLYWQCVDVLDRRMGSVFSFIPDDAMVLILGDHGEELSVGFVGHARPYEPNVRVPLYIKNGPNVGNGLNRQIDIAPAILDKLNLEMPVSWKGKPFNQVDEPALIINKAGETVYLGLRTEQEKYVRISQEGETFVEEYYDLVEDPAEENPESKGDRLKEMRDTLEELMDASRIELESLKHSTGMDDDVIERLETLGYR